MKSGIGFKSRIWEILALVQQRGLIWFLGKASLRLMALPFMLLGFLPALILRFCGIRILNVGYQRIGHLALEPDCYIKEEMLGLHPPYKAVVCAPRNKTANPHLVRYWNRYVHFITSPVLCLALRPICGQRAVRFDLRRYTAGMNETPSYIAVQAAWRGRPPLLELTETDRRRGAARLRELGVPEGAWFVCIHNREGGYSPVDEHVHSYRNSEIDSYLLAMEAIIARGGWCIRIGDRAMKKLPSMERVVDYAHHELRADWMDIFLCASCRFFLGNSSGAFLLSSIFGVPAALANLAPFSAVLPFQKDDLGIPKLLWSENDNRLLGFKEALDSPIATARHAADYVRAGVLVIDNSAEEIRDLALEQLGRVEGRLQYSPEDDMLQERFKSLLRPGHYTYGSSSRVSREFLRKYSYLLSCPGDTQRIYGTPH